MKSRRTLVLDRHDDVVFNEHTRWTAHVVMWPMMDGYVANRRGHFGDAVLSGEVEDLWPLSRFDRPHLPTFLQHYIDDRSCIDHLAECIEVVEEGGEVGGREVDCFDAGLAGLDVTPTNGNIVREYVGVVPSGFIFEAGVRYTRTVAVDEGKVLTGVRGSLDARGRFYGRQEFVRVHLQHRAGNP